MIIDWMNGDGSITRFDSNGQVVAILETDLSVREVRAASVSEIERFEQLAPADAAQMIGNGDRTAVLNGLNSALSLLRGITSDLQVTPQELEGAFVPVMSALEAYRDYNATDHELTLTATLVVAQICQGILLYGKSTALGVQAVLNQTLDLRSIVESP